MNILLIPMEAPYDGVRHAGGNIANYYLNAYAEQPDMDVTLITWKRDHEVSKLYYERKGIRVFLHECPGLEKKIHNKIYEAADAEYAGYMFDIPYGEDIEKDLKRLKKSGYAPNVVMLQWTQIVLLERTVKKYYPNVKVILIEEDVSFLGFYRRYRIEKRARKALLKKYLYKRILKQELGIIRRNELTIVNNEKDYRLLKKFGIPEEKIYRWIPYYHSYGEIERSSCNRYEILFFGALYREENYTAVIWFIENVFPKLDKRFTFTVLGNQPDERLMKFRSERITFTGFVEDIRHYFSRCLCMAAPLQLGAGIKIKVLEAMSAGVPVLTGKIGIEGITACHNKKYPVYLHCETPQEYVEAIHCLVNDQKIGNMIGEHAKKLIKNKFNLEKSKRQVLSMVREIGQ